MPATATASISLSAPIRIPAETFPLGAAAGDLNGDGRADAVSLEANSTRAAVRLALGSGSFAAPLFVTTVLYPDTVALYDMNGDGRLDLITSSALMGALSISLGNGDGTFGEPIMSPVPGGGGRFVAGDFNGDGKLDLAMNQLFPQSIAILEGNGDGHVTLTQAYAIGNNSFAVTAGDLNNDGTLDLAVGTYDGPVVILRGNGDGTFVEAGRFTTPGQVRGIVAADINSDGRLDLVTAYASASTNMAASVFLGTGGGSFGAAHDLWGDGVVFQAFDLAVADLDRDGKPDIVLAGPGAGVFRGNGDGTFAFPQPIGNTNFDRIALGDFNGDGQTDVMLTAYVTNELWFVLSTGDTTPPILNVPADIAGVEATGSGGAVVTFSVSAHDDTDPSPSLTCTPASGSTFPLGSTTVTCTATDAAGNRATATFVVHVRDTTPPVLTVPGDLAVDATSPAGADVGFGATATDAVDPAPVVTCTPGPGIFAIGDTKVTCTATDSSGNAANASFTVHVRGAGEQITALMKYVDDGGIGPGTSLHDKLAEALSQFAAGQLADACSTLRAFVSQVRALPSNQLSEGQSSYLIGSAARIRTVIGC